MLNSDTQHIYKVLACETTSCLSMCSEGTEGECLQSQCNRDFRYKICGIDILIQFFSSVPVKVKVTKVTV